MTNFKMPKVQFYDKEEIKAVNDVMLSGQIAEGERCVEFETKLANYLDISFVNLVNSGSSANLTAIMAMTSNKIHSKFRLDKGKEVITTALGFPTTVSPIIYAGGIPVFVDVEDGYWNVNCKQLESAITDKTVGIILAHTLGNPFNVEEIERIARKYRLWVIEDNADCLGGEWGRKKTGTLFDIGTSSFYPAHHISSLDYTEPIIIKSPQGEIRILEIGDFIENYDYKGWGCISFNKKGELTYQNITGVIKHPCNELLYKIVLQTGRNTIVTGTHSVFRLREDTIEEVAVSKLSVGDSILVPKRLPSPGTEEYIKINDFKIGSWIKYKRQIELNNEWAFLLGWFIAEGSTCKSSKGNYNITFNMAWKELVYAERIQDILGKMGIKSRIYRKGENGLILTFSNKMLYLHFRESCGTYSYNKRIPAYFFSANKEIKETLVNTMYLGDGCEHRTYGKHIGFSRDYVTVSKWLAIDLFYLLQMLNINARYSVKQGGSTRIFGKYISDTRKVWTVCYSKKSILDSNGYRGDKKTKRYLGELVMAKITKISKVKSTKDSVYDLSVKGFENFVGGIGVALHNTAEGGAVYTNKALYSRIINSFVNWGRDCWCKPNRDNTCGKRFEWKIGDLPLGYDHKYIFTELGFNLKMTDLQAAIGIIQLTRLGGFIKARLKNYQFWEKLLGNYGEYFEQTLVYDKAKPSWFGYIVVVKPNNKFSPLDFRDYLEDNKIPTRALFAGNIIKQPMMIRKMYKYAKDLGITNKLMNNAFWVGVQPTLTKEHKLYITKVVNKFFNTL